jgi:hypothetical protein
MKSIRAKNVPGSGVGKKRYDLYFNGFRQIEKARRQGFYLECIAILESIMADRLEARRASLNPDEPEKHRFSMLGNLTSKLKIEDKDLGIQGVYSEIAVWADKRNRAIHQMVKLGDEESTKTWEDRYAELEPTVEEGTELVERLSAKVKRLNQDDHKRRAKLNKD